MAKLSLIVPSRDERFLIPTIHDAFRNARGEFEVVAVLDSDKWPEGWKEVTDKYPSLHTIHHGQSKGMRAAINSGVGSAISRGAKFIAKFDGHCSFSEGFDEVLKAECEPNWIVVPRRGRLDPENWVETELNKPPIDYHYLSFPDDPNDFGGPGLNGKPWLERAVERKDILLDEEMSSQGSGWFMHAAYFNELELMDEANYGPFWSEFQELGLKCWLSGGKVMVNKKCKYLHLHKGKTYGRGYHLPESWLKQGRNHVMLWPWNEAWPRQTLPFSWLIEHFWPVPTWPENWEEALYATRKPRTISVSANAETVDGSIAVSAVHVWANSGNSGLVAGLVIHNARYGISDTEYVDVREQLKKLAKDGGFDFIVNNSNLAPGQNPFRGKKKHLTIEYSFGVDGEPVTRVVEEKDWLIIGPASQRGNTMANSTPEKVAVYTEKDMPPNPKPQSVSTPPMTAPALNDYLIRKFSISPQRLRGPMPIELRDFHRNDLAQLFAELGFKRGAEVGVAEGHFSEILCQSIPNLEKLYCVDPWYRYSDNPQNKSKEKHEFAFNETKRRLAPYMGHVQLMQEYSMDAVREIPENYLDFVNIDGHHGFDFVIRDIIEWSYRIRSGGVILLDDYMYLDRKRWGAGVVEAVQAYTSAHGIHPWFICQGHRSVDSFWVKP